MPRKGGSKRSKSGPFLGLLEPPRCDGIHIYLFWSPEGERYASHSSGPVSAEELCITAAEAVGITPLCHVLFALYDPLVRCWYSPNHVFIPKENSCLVLHFCMRFYFRNWHGLNKAEPTVSRYTLKNGTEQSGSILLEKSALEYLFSQAKYGFVNEAIATKELPTEEEERRFKDESLGMAVLHLAHHAMQGGCSLQQVAEKISFESCIPKSFARQISKDTFLTKLRIRRVFAEFMRTFQHTVDKRKLGTQEVICNYISTLEHLAPCFGTETFAVSHLDLRKDVDGSSLYSDTTHAQGVSKDNFTAPTTHEILVSGTKGIQWRAGSAQKAQANNYMRNGYTEKTKSQSRGADATTPEEWTSFCDFPEISHIAISGANVCISTQDNNYMEVQMNSSQEEARSFISLLDGYYRLTADAHHYLCHEVAPPRVVLSEANGLHGPMQDGFVLLKLKKEAAEEGAFLVRWSALDYRRIILAVLNKNEDGSVDSCHKQFRIQQKGSSFCLDGWEREFSSVKELTDSLKTFVLRSGSDSFTVKKCCLPKQGELSNLLVIRNGAEPVVHKKAKSLELRINPIKDKDLRQGPHLGRGTRTNIYSGWLKVQGRGEFNNNNLANPNERRVVLKILEQSHEDIALAFLETASFMSQVSHSHLVFVHGVSYKESKKIMVEEYVEFGPLDVFLRREKAEVTTRWKFIVAKQLASALNYLGTKQLVHGNVCGNNILVARRGLEPGTSPFVKLSDPGIGLHILSREERLERIPWIAPECIDSDAPISSAADQWSFGTTLLEICNNGDLPMSGSTLAEKESFYQQKGRLPEPSSQELASFISWCLSYDPVVRPSFPCVLRQLTEIMIRNPDISTSDTCPEVDPSVFHKRFLIMIRELGVGHFGKVSLCSYDPAHDGTGMRVAVKSLKQEKGDVPKSWLKEIDILKSLYHDNIVKYKGCCTEMGGQVVQLIMEYLPLGSLRDYLPKRKQDMSQCLLFAQQICEGMDYLHQERYIHRDLAARNVLVENDQLVKIGDFGLTKQIPEGELYYRVLDGGDSPVYWYAIECLKENKFSFASDIWSFAVTFYEILTRCDEKQSPPKKFSEMMELSHRQVTVLALSELLERQQRLSCPRDCPHEVKRLVEQCWVSDRLQRPSFKSLISSLKDIRQKYNWPSNVNFGSDFLIRTK